MTQSTEQERTEFEVWLAPEYSREKWHTGEYTDDTVFSMFAAWQAARRAQVVKGNHVTFQAQGGETAPVQMPEPLAVAFRFETEENGPTETSFYPSDRIGMGWTALYTEHQFRQLLAAHGIQEQST